MKNNKTYIVAEIGNNHEGSMSNVFKLIDEAKSCGVDAVKFQTFKVENFISNSIDETKHRLMKKFQLSYDDFMAIRKYCRKKKIDFFSTPLDLDSAKFLNNIQKVFKISSGDNNYYELIDLVKSFGKPIIISTGLLNFKEVIKLKDYVKKRWKKEKKYLTLMHCVSSYPVPNEEVNLSVVNKFVNQFKDCMIGYSDHSIGPNASIYSVAYGAKIVEKHFTLDKKFSSFRDHALSADIKDMKYIVDNIRNIEKIAGLEEKKIQKSEKINLLHARRSVSSKIFLKKNTFINNKDFKMLRPGSGFQNIKNILGKKINKNILPNTIIKKNDLS